MVPGDVCGGYRLEELIHEGGFAEIWYALGEGGSPVVVRALRKRYLWHPRVRRRFERGVRYLTGLPHPNLPAVYGSGNRTLRPYAVLEYIEGHNLMHWVFGDDTAWYNHRWTVLIGLASALQHLHAHGLLHLDVKPENVLLSHAGEVRLTDFDLACSEAQAAREWREPAGTPAYLAPELLRGGVPTRAADMYGFGKTARLLFPEKTGTLLDDYLRLAIAPLPFERPDGWEEIIREAEHARDKISA
jgi:serine/threonine protein kinase